jgi:hypothetical protein
MRKARMNAREKALRENGRRAPSNPSRETRTACNPRIKNVGETFACNFTETIESNKKPDEHADNIAEQSGQGSAG